MPSEIHRLPRRRPGAAPDQPETAPDRPGAAADGAEPRAQPRSTPPVERRSPPLTRQDDSGVPGASRASGSGRQATNDRRRSAHLQFGTEGERTIRTGRHAGDRSVRIIRPRLTGFRALAQNFLIVEEEEAPKGLLAVGWRSLKRGLIGRPIATAQQAHERLTKVKALAVYSSDALSSVAYSTEAILVGLIFGGAAALPLVLPIALTIAVLLAIIATSYRQTIYAYPNGGGSYIVAKENLGILPGLVAGAALLIDYVLTVAVSISAGISAITSAFPALRNDAVLLCLICAAVITVLNLRGVRESGTIFAAPTYLFIFAMLGLIATGLVKLVFGGLSPVETGPGGAETLLGVIQPIGAFLILNAFAQGCSAITGVEAISNGVPAFKPPESKNAARTLTWMAALLGVMVVGSAILARALGLVPHEGETILSMIGTAVFGRGPLYQFLQWSTFLILVLAANTAFADFPRLASIMARDRFLPSQFSFRGDRLAFTNGILVLGLLAAGLITLYGGSEQALIPLYAVGVFLSFTLSQAGMVVHWWRLRGPNWRRSILVNGVGTITTLVVLGVIVASKFVHGAWMVVLLIPTLVAVFLLVYRHYHEVADQLAVSIGTPDVEPGLDPWEMHHTILIPVGDLNRAALRAVGYARSLTGQIDHPGENSHTIVVAIHITDDLQAGARLRERWARCNIGVPLIVVESPYRSLVGPLLTYINALERQAPDESSMVTVLLPELVPAHWWEHLLHTQTALRLKGALLFRPRTAVTSVPYHLRSS